MPLWITIPVVVFAIWLFWAPRDGALPDYSRSNEAAAPEKAVKPDAVAEGMVMCESVKNTGMATKCEVQGWGKTVDVRIDTSSAEARKMCAGIAQQMQQIGSELQRSGWKLRIFSPYSGDEPIAVCNF